MFLKQVIIFFLVIVFPTLVVHSQTIENNKNQDEISPIKRYDEIIDETSLEDKDLKNIEEIIPHDEFTIYLPNLNSPLYKGWSENGKEEVWHNDGKEVNFVVPLTDELLNELGIEKVLRQTYVNGDYKVDVYIYKFKDIPGTYSAYTFLRNGKPARVKIGKDAYESKNTLTFWSGNFLIDINSSVENEVGEVKGFIILIAQEIATRFKKEEVQIPPAIAIQLPLLNRIKGTEKFCIGPICYKKYFPSSTLEFDPTLFLLENSEGIVTAEYKLSDDPKEDTTLTLVLIRYKENHTAELAYNSIREFYEKKETGDKEIKVDIQSNETVVKNNKKDYTVFHQKGNLFALVYKLPHKKYGEKILKLIPWPVEIRVQ